MKSFAYKCKFCGRDGIVQADEKGLEMFKPEVWIPKICCNRCGTFMERKRKLETAINRICRIVETCRINLSGEKRSGTETKARENLVSLTKQFASLVCEYYRVTNVWEPEFAEMIFEKPDKASVALGAYIRGVAREVRRA